MEKTRGTGSKLHRERFYLNLGCPVTPVSHWKNLPGDMVESPSLDVLKMNPDGV